LASSPRESSASNQGLALIELAATIMQEECEDDPTSALKRAAKRLGSTPARWPSVARVRAALTARLALFEPRSVAHLDAARRAALEALAFFTAFKARAVGGLIDGSFPAGGAIQIECVCDTPDQLSARLDELKIPATQHQRHELHRTHQPDRSNSGAQLKTWFEFRAGDFNYQLRTLAPGEHGYPADMCADSAKLQRLLNAPAPSVGADARNQTLNKKP
jgi:hypothetical protein